MKAGRFSKKPKPENTGDLNDIDYHPDVEDRTKQIEDNSGDGNDEEQ